MYTRLKIAKLALALALCSAALAQAQVAGSTTALGVSVMENTELTMGWSAKRGLLGKSVYDDKGTRIGKVQDLIISPDKRLSYVIVGAGGFIGFGRHDVAVPTTQLQESAGKWVMPGATKDTLKALPAFDYANDSAKRQQFIADTEKDVERGKTAIADLEKKAETATAEAKAKLMEQIAALTEQVKSLESKLTELKSAGVQRWHEFEAAIRAATTRLRDALKSSGN